jgi:hypothetical protein
MIFNNLQRINFTLTLMIIVFNKYQGTENDFIILDNRKAIINPDDSVLSSICGKVDRGFLPLFQFFQDKLTQIRSGSKQEV